MSEKICETEKLRWDRQISVYSASANSWSYVNGLGSSAVKVQTAAATIVSQLPSTTKMYSKYFSYGVRFPLWEHFLHFLLLLTMKLSVFFIRTSSFHISLLRYWGFRASFSISVHNRMPGLSFLRECLYYDSDIYGRKYTKLSYLVNGYGRVEGNISRKPLNMKSGLILTVEDYFFYAQIGNWQKILKSIKDNYDFRKSRIILRSESDFMRCRKSKKTELYYTSILFF